MIKEREKKPRGRKLSSSDINYMSKPEKASDRAKKHFQHKPYTAGGKGNSVLNEIFKETMHDT